MLPFTNRLARLPYWLLAAILLGIIFLWIMLTNADYRVILNAVARGVGTTVYVTAIAYLLAIFIGLVFGIMRVSQFRLYHCLYTNL